MAVAPDLLEIAAELPEIVVRARVLPGCALPDRPEWHFRTVSAGPLRSSPGYEAHRAATFGSSYDFGDEMRFAREGNGLCGVVLTLPDRNADDPEALSRAWRDAPAVAGVLALETVVDFNLAPVDVRAMDHDGEALLATLDPATEGDSSRRLRVAVAPDLELLFAAGRYAGWRLARPVDHLRPQTPGEAEPPGAADTVALVREYLDLVAEPNLDRMADGDRDLERAILDLERRAGARGQVDPAARAVADALRDVHGSFY